MIQPDNLTKTMGVVIATITAPAELLGFLYFTIFNLKGKRKSAIAAPIFPRYTPVVFWSQYAAFLARQGAFPPASFRSGEFGIRRCFNWLCVDGHLTRDNEISSFSPLYYRHFCAVWFCRSQDTRSSDENIFFTIATTPLPTHAPDFYTFLSFFDNVFTRASWSNKAQGHQFAIHLQQHVYPRNTRGHLQPVRRSIG